MTVGCVDENAFGLLVSWFDVEHDEYALDRAEFVRRFGAFREAMVECLRELPLGEGVRAVDLGHAFYAEVADGDYTEDPVAWLKMARARAASRDVATVGVLTFGSRWVDEASGPDEEPAPAGAATLITVGRPSEPLRRALDADAATRPREDGGEDGWGSGLYLDVEAIEALDRTPKNAPTVLLAGGAGFYRAGA